jgi:hypothetical protein
MRELTSDEVVLVSGGEYLDYFILEAVKNQMKINIKPTKVFDGKFEAEMFNFPTLEEIQENLRIWQEQQAANAAPQPSAPAPAPAPDAGWNWWDWNVHVH